MPPVVLQPNLGQNDSLPGAVQQESCAPGSLEGRKAENKSVPWSRLAGLYSRPFTLKEQGLSPP